MTYYSMLRLLVDQKTSMTIYLIMVTVFMVGKHLFNSVVNMIFSNSKHFPCRERDKIEPKLILRQYYNVTM